MKRSIIIRQLSGKKTLVKYIESRLSLAFARTSHAIQSLAITVSDINGPKGSIDKQCQIVLKPAGLRSIVITERQPNTRHAIFRAFARASKNLAKKMQCKQRNFRKALLPKPSQPELVG